MVQKKKYFPRKNVKFWFEKKFLSKPISRPFHVKIGLKKFEPDFRLQYINVGPDFFENFEPKSGWPDPNSGPKVPSPTRPELEIFRLDTALKIT